VTFGWEITNKPTGASRPWSDLLRMIFYGIMQNLTRKQREKSLEKVRQCANALLCYNMAA
jgi:hypothetical protein